MPKGIEEIKEKLIIAPILRVPNKTFPFHIHTYASYKVVGVALGKLEGNFPCVIYLIC